MRIGHKEHDGLTYKKIVEERKKKEVEYNMNTFGNVSIGIHGKELPKFSENKTGQKWWTMKPDYHQKPNFQSRLEMKQDQKFWAQNDPVLMSDVVEDPAPVDPLKKEFVPKVIKADVPEKINLIPFYGEEEDPLNVDLKPIGSIGARYLFKIFKSSLDGLLKCRSFRKEFLIMKMIQIREFH